MKSVPLQLALLLLISSTLIASNAAPLYEKYTCEGGYFSASAPKDWSRTEQGHPYGDMTKVYGVKLRGPKDRDGAAATISLLYYSGEEFFTDHQQYINARLNSMAREDRGEKKEMVPVSIGGLRGTSFSIKTFELVYRHDLWKAPPVPDDGSKIYEIAPPSTKVIMAERFIVLPAGKGFYVLHYRVPEGSAGEYQKIFDDVTAAFHPTIKQ